jgi:hypothetical protein
MTRRERIALVVGVAVAGIVVAAVLPPIPQDPAYHRFADYRTLLGIPNALNVLSNAPFVLAGVAGLALLRPGPGGAAFLDGCERWPYVVFFAGLVLTAFGSAWYHLDPGNGRLVWDRLPLAVTIMGLFAAAIAERVSVRAGAALLGPLVALGLFSVLYWHAGELHGRGDLRLYGLVQFYPMLAVPLMMALFPPRYTRAADLGVAVGIYAGAKVFEALDGAILAAGHVVSGHTIKHVFVALAGYQVARMLRARAPLTEGTR